MSNTAKIIKPHGMSSEKASRIKNRGHNKEHLLAGLIGGEVIKGTNKLDVRDKKGKLYTVKGGSEIKGKEGRDGRWQLFMYKKSRFEAEKDYPARKIFMNILDIFPKNKQDYDINPEPIKEQVKKPMKKLKKYLSKTKNMSKFFNKSIFNNKIDYLAIYHDDVFHIFSKEDVLKTFENCFKVINNATYQKVVFSYNNKIAIEIEVRKTEGKYPSILLITTKKIIFNILSNHIKKMNKATRNLYVYGNAIKTFSL